MREHFQNWGWLRPTYDLPWLKGGLITWWFVIYIINNEYLDDLDLEVLAFKFTQACIFQVPVKFLKWNKNLCKSTILETLLKISPHCGRGGRAPGFGGPGGRPRLGDDNKGKTSALAAVLPGLKFWQISAAPLCGVYWSRWTCYVIKVIFTWKVQWHKHGYSNEIRINTY